MFSLLVQNGDLQLGANGFATVNGSAKIYQDLNMSTLEPFGCDRFHPRWGSLLSNYIGDAITPAEDALVQAEISRLVNNYILVQQDNIAHETALGLQSQYATNEVVGSLESVTITQKQDHLMVDVLLLTMSGEQVALQSQVAV